MFVDGRPLLWKRLDSHLLIPIFVQFFSVISTTKTRRVSCAERPKTNQVIVRQGDQAESVYFIRRAEKLSLRGVFCSPTMPFESSETYVQAVSYEKND